VPSADTAASPHTFTGNVTLVSDYRFRGISQTYKGPAFQGGFDYAVTEVRDDGWSFLADPAGSFSGVRRLGVPHDGELADPDPAPSTPHQ